MNLIKEIAEIAREVGVELIKDYDASLPTPKDGHTPVKGVDYYTAQEQQTLIDDILPRIPTPKNGKDGKDGKNGKDGIAGRDGKDGQNGKNGKDGKDGHTPIAGVDFPIPKDGKDGASRVGWGAHPLTIQASGVVKDKIARVINFIGPSVVRNPDGTVDVTVSGSAAWGDITGTLSNQTDLQAALDLKAAKSFVIAMATVL